MCFEYLKETQLSVSIQSAKKAKKRKNEKKPKPENIFSEEIREKEAEKEPLRQEKPCPEKNSGQILNKKLKVSESTQYFSQKTKISFKSGTNFDRFMRLKLDFSVTYLTKKTKIILDKCQG